MPSSEQYDKAAARFESFFVKTSVKYSGLLLSVVPKSESSIEKSILEQTGRSGGGLSCKTSSDHCVDVFFVRIFDEAHILETGIKRT